MKTRESLELLSLVIGMSAVIVITFYLATNYGKPIYFTEPIAFIRISEIILGLISLPFLFSILIKKVKSFENE